MEASLQPNINFVIRRIELQVQKLSQAIEKFGERDKHLFARVVDAVEKHDIPRARVFANEVAEIRKMERLILRSKMALEQILSRIIVIKTYGDALTVLPPAARIMRAIAFQIDSIFPESGTEIKEIRKAVCVMIVDTGEVLISSINFGIVEKEASAIIAEIDRELEEEMENRFPDLPTIEEIRPSHASDEAVS